MDYLDTFFPAPVGSSIRFTSVLAVKLDLKLTQLNIQHAFTQSTLNGESYAPLPQVWGKVGVQSVACVEAQKFQQVSGVQVEGVCLPRGPGRSLHVIVHVGDLIVANMEADGYSLARFRRKPVSTSNLGELTNYTGYVFERDWDSGTLEISRITYINEHVGRADIATASPLRSRQEGKEVCTKQYQEAVGSLLWLTNTIRLNISNAVREVARRSHDSSVKH